MFLKHTYEYRSRKRKSNVFDLTAISHEKLHYNEQKCLRLQNTWLQNTCYLVFDLFWDLSEVTLNCNLMFS